MAAQTFKARISGLGDPQDVGVFDAQTLLNPLTINQVTGSSYTLVLSDAGKMIHTTYTGANVITVPPNSGVAFPTGTMILFNQIGGVTTMSPFDGGVIVSGRGSAIKSAGQYAQWSIFKYQTNSWLLAGDLTTV